MPNYCIQGEKSSVPHITIYCDTKIMSHIGSCFSVTMVVVRKEVGCVSESKETTRFICCCAITLNN